jgi:hypothetical protein
MRKKKRRKASSLKKKYYHILFNETFFDIGQLYLSAALSLHLSYLAVIDSILLI